MIVVFDHTMGSYINYKVMHNREAKGGLGKHYVTHKFVLKLSHKVQITLLNEV